MIDLGIQLDGANILATSVVIPYFVPKLRHHLGQHQTVPCPLNNTPPRALHLAVRIHWPRPPNLLHNLNPRPDTCNSINLDAVIPGPKPLLLEGLKGLSGGNKRRPEQRRRNDLRLCFNVLYGFDTLEDGLHILSQIPEP